MWSAFSFTPGPYSLRRKGLRGKIPDLRPDEGSSRSRDARRICEKRLILSMIQGIADRIFARQRSKSRAFASCSHLTSYTTNDTLHFVGALLTRRHRTSKELNMFKLRRLTPLLVPLTLLLASCGTDEAGSTTPFDPVTRDMGGEQDSGETSQPDQREEDDGGEAKEDMRISPPTSCASAGRVRRAPDLYGRQCDGRIGMRRPYRHESGRRGVPRRHGVSVRTLPQRCVRESMCVDPRLPQWVRVCRERHPSRWGEAQRPSVYASKPRKTASQIPTVRQERSVSST